MQAHAEAQASTDPEPRCRLCLQWTDEENDASRGLLKIFTEDDESLPFKIRDCLGVFVSPEDSIRTICTNCRQTVSLIDEFRTLCRQTEEIYESVRIRCKDSDRSERYGKYVGELRKLVQEHKDTINKQLVGVESVEGTADEDSISQHFVPMLLVKDEPEENDEDWGDEPMAMESVEIKPERLPTDESDGEMDENNDDERSEAIDCPSYEQQVKIAQEVLKRLKQFTSNMGRDKELWGEIAQQVDMEYSAIKARWKRMKQSYLTNKEDAATGNRRTILRLKVCTLFNLMNQIIPELDDSVEPWVAPESLEQRSYARKLIPMGTKIAIAEEIEKRPELWDKSRPSSTHKMDKAWKTIARKFKMDVTKLQRHWRALKDIYRAHRNRVTSGATVRTKTDRQYYKLIDTLHPICQTNEGEGVKQEPVADQSIEQVLEVLKAHRADGDAEDKPEKILDPTYHSQKMSLAKLVYKHPHLWNKKHQEFHNAVARDATWDRIAVTLNKSREETKYAWKCLRDLYRGRVKRLKQGLLRPDSRVLHEPLFRQLEVMCAGNMRIGTATPVVGRPPAAPKVIALPHNMDESESDDSPEDDEDGVTVEGETVEHLKLATLLEKHEIVWNTQHPAHTNLEKRDMVWDSIARQMNLSTAKTKALWTRLRNVYRCRRLRLLKGNISKNNHLLREPLYRKLNGMLKHNMQLGKNGGKISQDEPSESANAGTYLSMDNKIRLVEEVIKHEFLWNTTHPDFHNAALRDDMWKRIALSMNQSYATVKYAFKLLRDSYRSRMKRMQQTNTDPNELFEFDPLFHKLNMMFSKSIRVHNRLRAALANTAEVADESDSNDVMEDREEDDTVEYDNQEEDDDTVENYTDENLKLAVLCQKNELIWNSKDPSHMNFEKRDAVWDSIAQEMNLPKDNVKEMWTRLRNIYRTRRLRFLRGSITSKNHLLCDPLYRKLDAMLRDHMQLGKHGGGFPKKAAAEKEPVEPGPFATMENKVKLVEEVFKHELLWNTTHVDYFKSELRGANWNQIAEMFDNCDTWAVKREWRRLRNMHRPRKTRAAPVYYQPIKDNEDDESTGTNPLYELFSKMAETFTAETEPGNPAEEGESSGTTHSRKVKKRRLQEITDTYMTHKRRYTGKRSFDDEGCIKVNKAGTVRYEKICELCGKQIERSYFEYHMNQHNGLKPYVCSFEGCGREYSNKITRDRHEVTAHDDGYKFECNQCDEKFKYRSIFDYHYASKHESQRLPCLVCGKLLKHQKGLQEHVKRHNGHFPCPVCGKVLLKKYSLTIHMRTHTNEKPYPCDICGQCFMLKVQLKTHLGKVHQLSWEEFQASYGSTSQHYFKSELRGATWNQIAEMFDNCDAWAVKSEWRRLRNMHRPRKTRAAPVYYQPVNDNEEDESTGHNPLYELFSKMAETLTGENEPGNPAEEGESSGATHSRKVKKRRLQEITETYMTHKRRYTGKRSFDDEGCIKVTRAGIVRYEKICELCGKQIERSYFEYHMNQHNGLKPYVCSFEGCGREYSNKITRDRHEVLIHDDGYKFKCDQCDEKFKYRSTFDYHYAIKHESQRVPCPVCGKLLKHQSLLKEHVRRHTGHFPCPVCGKVLQKKYSLTIHMRTHTNEKPYACDICGQCFMLKVQLKTHLGKVHQLSWEEFQAIYGSTSQQ